MSILSKVFESAKKGVSDTVESWSKKQVAKETEVGETIIEPEGVEKVKAAGRYARDKAQDAEAKVSDFVGKGVGNIRAHPVKGAVKIAGATWVGANTVGAGVDLVTGSNIQGTVNSTVDNLKSVVTNSASAASSVTGAASSLTSTLSKNPWLLAAGACGVGLLLGNKGSALGKVAKVGLGVAAAGVVLPTIANSVSGLGQTTSVSQDVSNKISNAFGYEESNSTTQSTPTYQTSVVQQQTTNDMEMC